MQRCFPSCCLPSPVLQSEYFFVQQPASNCFLDQFHNTVPTRRSTTSCTYTHVGNNVLLLHLHPPIIDGYVFANDGMLLLPEYKYRLHDCNDSLTNPILPADLNHDNSELFYNGYVP